MILESAILQIRIGPSAAFEKAFRVAQAFIASIPGYISHELQSVAGPTARPDGISLACAIREVGKQHGALLCWRRDLFISK